MHSLLIIVDTLNAIYCTVPFSFSVKKLGSHQKRNNRLFVVRLTLKTLLNLSYKFTTTKKSKKRRRRKNERDEMEDYVKRQPQPLEICFNKSIFLYNSANFETWEKILFDHLEPLM